MNIQPMLWEVAGMMMACDCPTCAERGFVVEAPDGRGRRCHVCGWLMRRLEDEEKAAEWAAECEEFGCHGDDE